MSFFFKKRSTTDLNIYVDDPNYGVIIQDDVPVGDPCYTSLKSVEEKEVRKIIDRLCKILNLPSDIELLEVDISFK